MSFYKIDRQKASNIDMVKIDFDGNDIQIFFWPEMIISGSMKTYLDMPTFRGYKIEELDYGTEFYELTVKEADKLISMCQVFTVELLDEDRNPQLLDQKIGEQKSFKELMKAIKPLIEEGSFES